MDRVGFILPELDIVNMVIIWKEGCYFYLGRSYGHGDREHEPWLK